MIGFLTYPIINHSAVNEIQHHAIVEHTDFRQTAVIYGDAHGVFQRKVEEMAQKCADDPAVCDNEAMGMVLLTDLLPEFDDPPRQFQK